MTTAEPTVTHSTFTIERHYPAAPGRVFAAFADPAKKQRWFAEGEARNLESFEMDFRVGGNEKAVYRFKEGSPFPGVLLINHTNYQDIVPDRRVVMAYTMTIGDHRMSASLATVEFLPAGDGTDLVFTEQGAYFEGSDGVDRRRQGWTVILQHLDGQLAR
jgi:uncharacterized protein YndB with AHSA1/START domain